MIFSIRKCFVWKFFWINIYTEWEDNAGICKEGKVWYFYLFLVWEPIKKRRILHSCQIKVFLQQLYVRWFLFFPSVVSVGLFYQIWLYFQFLSFLDNSLKIKFRAYWLKCLYLVILTFRNPIIIHNFHTLRLKFISFSLYSTSVFSRLFLLPDFFCSQWRDEIEIWAYYQELLVRHFCI